MKPTEKSPQIDQFLNNLSGDNRKAAITLGFCIVPPIGCGSEVRESDFKDAISRKEYTISGLCQRCQDSIFGE